MKYPPGCQFVVHNTTGNPIFSKTTGQPITGKVDATGTLVWPGTKLDPRQRQADTAKEFKALAEEESGIKHSGMVLW